MHTDPKLSTLNDFLTALRFEGIPIGLHELIWLQHAFALEPELDRHHLKNLLACTLIKHLSQSETFDTLFDDWCPPEPIHVAQPTRASEKTEQIPTADHTFEEPFPQDQQPPSSTPTIEQFRPAPKPKRVWTTWPVWSSLGVCFIIGALAYSFFFNQTAPISKDIPKQTVGTSSQSSNSDSQRHPLPSNPVEEFWTWVPQVEIPPPPLIDTFWLSTSLALLSLLTGAVLLWRYRRQKIIPVPEDVPRIGPQWLPLRDLETSSPELLDRKALQTAVWGVERFVPEDETHRVHVDNTVAATAAAGGLPTMRFEPALYPREVWLWQDSMVQDATIDRLA